MLRVLLTVLLPLAAPFLIYIGWVWLVRHKVSGGELVLDWKESPWPWMLALGVCGALAGLFYIYFTTKEQVFSELVLEMGRLVRHTIAEATQDIGNRLEAEEAGLRAFLEFVQAHPDLYRIVQEALFVDPAAYEEYYRTFADGYRSGLVAAEAAGQISKGDTETRAWALMGIARALGEQLVVFKSEKPISELVSSAYDLIANGIKP